MHSHSSSKCKGTMHAWRCEGLDATGRFGHKKDGGQSRVFCNSRRPAGGSQIPSPPAARQLLLPHFLFTFNTSPHPPSNSELITSSAFTGCPKHPSRLPHASKAALLTTSFRARHRRPTRVVVAIHVVLLAHPTKSLNSPTMVATTTKKAAAPRKVATHPTFLAMIQVSVVERIIHATQTAEAAAEAWGKTSPTIHRAPVLASVNTRVTRIGRGKGEW